MQREWNLLSNSCSIARKEWKWLKENPFQEVRRPPPTAARDRLATDDEIGRLLFALGYERDSTPTTATARVGAAMLFAIETGMRAGEIAALRREDVRTDKRYLCVAGHEGGRKTSAAVRDVPLSAEALRLVEQMQGGETVFGLTTAQIDALFRKAKSKALIEDLHFHDCRHLAITRLSRKLDVLALARIVGHRDLRQLQLYYNATAEDLAARL